MLKCVKKFSCLLLAAAIMIPLMVSCSDKSDKYEKTNNLFSEGLAAVKTDGKWGYVDKEGRFIIKARFDDASAFSCGLAGVAIDEKYGYINTNGEIVIDLQFDGVASFIEERARVSVDEKCKYIDTEGSYISDALFDYGDDFSEGLACVMVDEKYGYINLDGEMAIEPRYVMATAFSSGLAGVREEEGGKCGFIDKKGKTVIDFMYDEVGPFVDGVARAVLNGTLCYIDTSGLVILTASNTSADDFHEGLARIVNEDELFGVVDTSGKTVIDCKYTYLGPFSNGLALAYDSEKVGYINKNGEYVINPEYSFFYSGSKAGFDFMDDGYVIVIKDNKFGVVDKEGNEILPCEYDGINGFTVY